LIGRSPAARARRWRRALNARLHRRVVALAMLLGMASHSIANEADWLPDSEPVTAAPSTSSSQVPAAAWAAYREGERLLRQGGVARDPVEACQRFDQSVALAAPATIPQGQYRVGLCHAYGWGRARDPFEAVRWYVKAAQGGVAAAQTRLGVALWRGQGVERDLVQAAQWLQRSARAGHAAGMLALGLMMQAGQVPGASARDGVAWLQRGAEAGDSSAAMALAQAYRSGLGVAADPASAGRWLQRAADARNPLAQIALAQWYLEGRLLERSPLHAYAWARIAESAAAGLSDQATVARIAQRAQAVRSQASVELRSAQLLEAQSLARDWTPGRIALHPAREVPTAAAGRTTLEPPIGLPAAIPEEPSRTERPAQRPRWSAGSGFYVSREGHLVTNEHVVRACRSVRLPDGQTVEVVGRDRRADLALLRARPVQAAAPLRLDNQVRQGEDVLTYGFPLHGVLSSSGQLGAGMVTALRGLRDNPLQLQIDVPVQSGNSGGPLIDQRGEVVGVVVSKLNALRVAQITGDIPQNVNFAVRLEPLKALLEKYQVPAEGSPARSPTKDRQTIAEEARRYTTVVLCERESAPGP